VELRSIISPADNIDAVLSGLQAEGAVLIPGFLGRPALDILLTESEKLLTDEPEFCEYLAVTDGCYLCAPRTAFTTGYPSMARTFSEQWMNEVATSFFGTEPFSFNYDITVALDTAKTINPAQDPHYDRFANLKFYIYLTDATIRNGMLFIAPGTSYFGKEQKARMRARGRWPTGDDTRTIPRHISDKLRPVTQPAGTLIVFDGDTVHRGMPPSSGRRIVVRARSYDPATDDAIRRFRASS
jgi:Phytanoyl-CoA dioxygenase (PhyH)